MTFQNQLLSFALKSAVNRPLTTRTLPFNAKNASLSNFLLASRRKNCHCSLTCTYLAVRRLNLLSFQTNAKRTLFIQAPRLIKKGRPGKLVPVAPEKQDLKFYAKHASGCFFLAMGVVYLTSVTTCISLAYAGFSDKFMNLVRQVPGGYGDQFLSYCQEKAKKKAAQSDYFKDNFSEKTIEIFLTALIMFLCLKPVKMVATLKLTQMCFTRKQAKGVIDKTAYTANKAKVKLRAKETYVKRRASGKKRFQNIKTSASNRSKTLFSVQRDKDRRDKIGGAGGRRGSRPQLSPETKVQKEKNFKVNLNKYKKKKEEIQSKYKNRNKNKDKNNNLKDENGQGGPGNGKTGE